MTTAPHKDRQLAHTRAASVQTYARIAAVLSLLSFVGGVASASPTFRPSS